ncbi:RNA polymerase sigma-70 factor, ECF subfamily [Dyadobacter soli]|uniref:RNA polymerase sigma-70 factor, ECF subfamily n=1 Tax=Dyadobacter soli TaxID=659014 RepID=A0A1G7A9Y0_9BACT|nr:sigma-70 family RNA polymerase sigma factor [Dyadobacter soli]SDE11493.1 RNA polymerase sigma-70 factor, ECF subfamily [Dyadobacter soli]
MQGYPYDTEEANEDRQRWTALIGGDRNALGALFDAYARQLLVYGYRICGDKTMARDAIQDVFVNLWLYRASLAPEVRVKFYLYKSLRRALLKQMAATRPTGTDEWENLAEAQPSPEAEWVVSETESQRSHRLLQSLSVLSDREREVISLKYFSDLKIREIAALLELREQTVSNTLQNALNKLRKHLVLGFLFCQVLFEKIF